MSHKLNRLCKSILEQPQLITQSRFEEIANVLDNHDAALIKTAHDAQLLHDKEDASSKSDNLAETTVGVLRIEGALTNKPTMFSALCGLTSYQELLEQADTLCSDENIKTIMMLVDSGGGESYNLFSTARAIKSKCNEADKKLVAYVDGISASASYGLTAVADEVIMHPDAMVGSIGVVVRLVNDNKAQENAGLKVTYITAGDSKVPFKEDGGFKDEYLAEIQTRVTEIYDNFLEHISENRGMAKADVRATEAKMFSAKDALKLGLVDKIMEGEEFYNHLADISQTPDTSSKTKIIQLEAESSVSQTKLSIEDKSMPDNKVETSVDTEMLAQLQATMKQQAEQLAMYQAKEVQAEKEKLSASLDKFTFLAENKDAVVSFLTASGVTKEHKTLLNSVMSSAQASYTKIEEKAASDIAEAQLKVEAVEAEKEKIKEEFGKESLVATDTPDKELSVTETLAAKVAEKKAAQAAKV